MSTLIARTSTLHALVLLSQHPGVSEDGLKFGIDMATRFNDVYRIYYGAFLPVLSCCAPSSLKLAIQGADAKPRGAFSAYEFIAPWLGT